jgi:NitT/TauT family transport system ATP-binding protein
MLHVRDLSVLFGPLHVLDHIFLTVGPREVVSILGPSGCGKTTLLRCIAGLLHPTSGEVVLDTAGLPEQPPISLAFQRPVLLDWLTIAENLRLPHRFAGRDYQSEAILNSLKAFKLEAFESYFPREISIGMAQRVCLARAISENARLLLLDEPLSGLDEITRRDVCTDLSNTLINRSAIFVTHSIHDAVFLGQRVITLSGRPTRVIKETKVDLPVPRSADLWLSDKLTPYLTALRNQLAMNL